MNITMLTQLIGSLGFPIAMCIALIWYLAKQTEAHKQEINKMIEAINNNTIALQKLESKIDNIGAQDECK